MAWPEIHTDYTLKTGGSSSWVWSCRFWDGCCGASYGKNCSWCLVVNSLTVSCSYEVSRTESSATCWQRAMFVTLSIHFIIIKATKRQHPNNQPLTLSFSRNSSIISHTSLYFSASLWGSTFLSHVTNGATVWRPGRMSIVESHHFWGFSNLTRYMDDHEFILRAFCLQWGWTGAPCPT